MKTKTPLNSILIILIGNELLNGSTVDKNANLLLKQLSDIKELYTEVMIIPDIEEIIVQKIKDSINKFDLIVTSGGLGPTSDDLTIEAIAKALDKKLVQDQTSFIRLEEKYKKRGRTLRDNNIKQTYFPEGATILTNEIGTADSCISKGLQNTFIATFPGVPSEFKFFITGPFKNWINETFNFSQTRNVIHFRIFGLSESYIGSIIDSLNLPSTLEVAYRPQFPEILISLKSNVLNVKELTDIKNLICSKIGLSFLISHDELNNLPITVSNLLKEKKLTVSFAESCSGGLLSSVITKIPDSSNIFLGSIICYSNKVKSEILNVPEQTLKKEGAVSEKVAEILAKECKALIKSDIAVSITGIAGPSGASDQKPIGLTFISICSDKGHETIKYELPWDRERNQIYATWLALDLVRRTVNNYDLKWEIQ